MKSFDHAVGLRVIRGGHDDLDAPSLGKLLEQSRRKLRSSVGCDYCWHSVILYPSGYKSVDD